MAEKKIAKVGDPQKEAQTLVGQFQTLQQQLQNVLVQKESLRLQLMGIDRALKELETAKQKNAYKITGPIMVSKPVDGLKEELKESKETINVHIKSLDNMENKMNAQLKNLQEKLKKFIS